LVCKIAKLRVYMCYFLSYVFSFFFAAISMEMHWKFGVVGYLPGAGCGDEVLR
jgi:hypothetical protein